MQQAVEDGIGKGWIADIVVPVLDGQLAGNDGGARAHAIVEHFEQIAAFAWADGGDREVIDQQQLCLGQGAQALWKLPSAWHRLRSSSNLGARRYSADRP